MMILRNNLQHSENGCLGAQRAAIITGQDEVKSLIDRGILALCVCDLTGLAPELNQGWGKNRVPSPPKYIFLLEGI